MKELLVPCGNMECLKAAVNNGCDAVYLGGKRFGARAFAGNFDDSEMRDAISYSHIYGVKVYVTVNTLIHEEELDSAIDYLKFLYKSGVDAVIIQDIGLMAVAKEKIPDLEIHASTQVHSTNQDTINFLEDLGVKRVVLAREMSISEINNLDTDLEIEAFIHGALCVSYSGGCLFSSMLMNRSGNRGECAQICRLPFKMKKNDEEIVTNGEYLLSTKELNTSWYFKEIMESNIYSLKIEGRMKSPEYVGCVTRLYRDLMDKYYRHEDVIPDENVLRDLSTIFNREYTKGFLFNANNKELMNIKTSNHVGVKIGDVIEVNKKFIKIKLCDELSQGDGVRFLNAKEGMIANFIYDIKGKLTNHASTGDVISLDKKFDVKVGDSLNKTLDCKIKDKYLNNIRKVLVDMEVICEVNKEMILTINAYDKIVKVTYGNVMEAINFPVAKETIEKQLAKLGNTPFKADKINIKMDDGIFINLKDLNELRRLGIEELVKVLTYREINVLPSKDKGMRNQVYQNDVAISVLARTEEQIKCALDNNVKRVYISDEKLYEKYKDDIRVLYRTNRVKDNYRSKALITELGSLNRIRCGVGDYYLNVCNHETIDYLSNYLEIQTLSVELSDDEIKDIMNYYENRCNVEMIIYGTIELMLMKYCPVNLNVSFDKVCLACKGKDKYYLVDRNNKEYRILNDIKGHYTHIMHYKPIDKRENKDYYYGLGIRNFRLELLDEDYEMTQSLLNSLNFNN